MVSLWITIWLMRLLVCSRWIAMLAGLLVVAVTGNGQTLCADLGLFPGQEIGQQATGATGHGPAQGAVTGIQEQVAVAGRPDDRGTVRGSRRSEERRVGKEWRSRWTPRQSDRNTRTQRRH